LKTNGYQKKEKNHDWWEPWKNSLRLINSVAADSSAALAVIILAKVLEYAVNNIEGKRTSHPNASDIVHYANLAVLFGVVGILAYRLLRRLYRDEN
jgi:H+/Cl- antiporter ClcA